MKRFAVFAILAVLSTTHPTGGNLQIANAASDGFTIGMPFLASDVGTNILPFGVHVVSHEYDGHPGWDVECKTGSNVRAAADGVIQSVFTEGNESVIQIQHVFNRRSYRTVYTSITAVEPGIAPGVSVVAGQSIGKTSTGIHFQLDDFSYNDGRTGYYNNSALDPLPYLNSSGLAIFAKMWQTTNYRNELVEPFPDNLREVTFPMSRAWVLESGNSPARIIFDRLKPTLTAQEYRFTGDYDYTLTDANGAVLEKGIVFVQPSTPFSTIDLQPTGGGATRLGIYDVLSDTMRIAWGSPGSARPTNLSSASVYTTQTNLQAYKINERGGHVFRTSGAATAVTAGYARIRPDAGGPLPSGLAIFGFRQNGVLVSEAGVPAARPARSGRIFAEIGASVLTGVAIANPNSQEAAVSFYFTDSNGQDFGQGEIRIPPNQQTARFLNEPPFNGAANLTGTFTFTSPLPISVIALRGRLNERSDFLITTLPVADISSNQSGTLVFPHFADGAGWNTQVTLINPTDEVLSGTIEFVGQGNVSSSGQPVVVAADGRSASTFEYTIAPRSAYQLRTSGTADRTLAGSVWIVPSANSKTPSGLGIFASQRNGITVSEAGVPGIAAARSLKMYAEVSGPGGNVQTAIAIANLSPSAETLNFELATLDGTSTGLKGQATIPGKGQISLFVKEIQGFSNLPLPFQGVLRIASNSTAGISVIGIRSRTNERNDFLFTTTPPVDENSPAWNGEGIFPHIVDGSGYTTHILLYSGASSGSIRGTVSFFKQSGLPLGLLDK